jgi:hypothetical protein
MVDILLHETRFVYGIKSLDLIIKVGVAKDIEKRLDDMRLHNPHGCELVFYRKTYAPFLFEKMMHELLADKAVGQEWFRVTVAELRQAAARAKSSSLSAELALERSQMKLARSRHAAISI